jgi:glycosyltransferase involved in cell wall biosynthesis
MTITKQLRVAVIISCFNSAKFLRQTINSVLNQSYEPIEVIAVDDGSTDDTRKILESHGSRIQILSHPNNQNRGQAVGFNLAIQYASADLISMLDHDDIFYPDKVSKQVEIFQKYSDVGFVYVNGHAIDYNDKILYKLINDDFQERNFPENILLDCYVRSCSSVMFRKKLIEKVGQFNVDLRYATDHDMWIRMSETTKFHYIPDCLIGYRIHPNQLSLRRELWEDGFIILRDACNRFPYGKNVNRKRLAVLYYRLGDHDFKRQKYVQSFWYFLLAGLLDPVRSLKYFKNSVLKSFLNLGE